MQLREEYDSATRFITSIMIPDDTLRVKMLVRRISKAPQPGRSYLQRHCRDAGELEEFLRDNDHLFFVKNGKVALFDHQLVVAEQRAVQYFAERLRSYNKPVHFMTFKEKYMELASGMISDYIRRFYPLKEFKEFLRARPDIFVVHRDRTVFLVEVDSVAFYKSRLKALKGETPHFIKFRGNIGQAPLHVQNYINTYCLGDSFQDFLIRNNSVFLLEPNGNVSLMPFQ